MSASCCGNEARFEGLDPAYTRRLWVVIGINAVMFLALAVATSFATRVIAGADDYRFEPVSAEVKKGDDVTVAVRLVQKSTNKPVSDAVIAKKRIDMAPDGMPTMDSPLTLIPSTEPGTYSFKTSFPMAGRWLMSIAAKVQGEPETVVGKVTYTVTP